MRVVSVVGARPQFIKAAMLSRVLRRKHHETLIHTGQHYDDLMSEVFFRELGLPAPDRNLGVGSASHGAQTARMLEALESEFESLRPDLVVVYGDTNSTLAGTLAAAKLGLPIAHVEAGLRSGVKTMPEEVNRIVADHLATWLFCPTAAAAAQLAREGIERGGYIVGDLMYDALVASLPRVDAVAPSVYARHGVEVGGYFLATVHRSANTDDPSVLASILVALAALPLPVLFPAHPRTREAVAIARITPGTNIRLIEPVGYFEMIALEKGSRAVLTDSGGVQREAYFLGIPCVTLREESEWPETLESAWNVLAGSDKTRIEEAALRPKPGTPPRRAFGDGRSAENILEILERDSRNSRRPS